jgi:hypothetical protein
MQAFSSFKLIWLKLWSEQIKKKLSRLKTHFIKHFLRSCEVNLKIQNCLNHIYGISPKKPIFKTSLLFN